MKVIGIVLSLFAVAGVAAAQEEVPGWEVSGGYQYMHVDLGSLPAQLNLVTQSSGIPNFNLPSSALNANGFNVSLQEHVNGWFGGVFDVSGAFPTLSMNVTPQVLASGIIPDVPNATYTNVAKQQLYTFLFGPQFTLRRSSRVQPFLRVMAGGAHERIDASLVENGAKVSEAVSGDTSVAFGGGGGMDIRVSDRVYFRVAADVIRTGLFNDTEENIRVTTAITYRIGR